MPANQLIVDALKELAQAIRDEREARQSGEYTDGNLWRVDEAIARLETHVDTEPAP
jgi:flagellar biosynthesis/type III secretory pathway ATPase